MPVIERTYAYQRIAPGLILQRGNDGETVYVIGRYDDGPSFGLDDEPRDFTAWGWGRLDDDLRARVERLVARGDVDDAVYELREAVHDNTWPRHKTMRAAIEDALRAR